MNYNKLSLFLLVFLSVLLVSCSEQINNDRKKIIINPYSNVDFSSASRIKAISHEHIYNSKQLKIAYDRGIRYFACVNYHPACPSYPLSKWCYHFMDYVSPSDLTLTTFTYSGSIPSFIDKDGNVINTDDLVQLPNAEHAHYADIGGRHFNVLGSLFGECTNGNRNTGEWSEEALGMRRNSWYIEHPKWTISDINSQYLDPFTLLFPGKVFGTINHSNSEKYTRKMIEACPNVFKAIEIVNQACSTDDNESFRELWDIFLREGKRLWGTSVVDWQDDNKLGACNVLLINDYENQTMIKKAEMGLDAYISGAYLPAGLADNDVLNLYNDDESIHIQVTGKPTEVILVTNKGKQSFKDTDKIDYLIENDVSYVRFEVWYYDDAGNLKDYLFTNPIFIEYQ